MAYNTRGAERAARLTACRECDLVQREPARAVSGVVRCRRCDAVLYRQVAHGLDATLALTLAAAILFTIANVLPVMSLEVQGQRVSTTLLGMAQALERVGMGGVALVVFVTLFLMPATKILARLYLLVPLRLGRTPRRMAAVSRILTSARAWSLVEVFVLAAVVCIHRLNQVGRLELEPAFWAIGAVMLLFAAADSVLDARTLWAYAAWRTA